jgi:hypothetical protein
MTKLGVESIGALNVPKIELVPALQDMCWLLLILVSACHLLAKQEDRICQSEGIAVWGTCLGLHPSVTECNVRYIV